MKKSITILEKMEIKQDTKIYAYMKTSISRYLQMPKTVHGLDFTYYILRS